jgi:hypothetical protein
MQAIAWSVVIQEIKNRIVVDGFINFKIYQAMQRASN